MSKSSPENKRTSNSREGVRRCLFGKRTQADKQKEALLFSSYLGSIAKQKSIKYNFDFENHRPLQGNFQWIKVPSRAAQAPSKLPFNSQCEERRQEGEKQAQEWSPLSSTTSKHNINNNHHKRNKMITDYFSKDLVQRPSNARCLPSIQHTPAINKRQKQKTRIQGLICLQQHE